MFVFTLFKTIIIKCQSKIWLNLNDRLSKNPLRQTFCFLQNTKVKISKKGVSHRRQRSHAVHLLSVRCSVFNVTLKTEIMPNLQLLNWATFCNFSKFKPFSFLSTIESKYLPPFHVSLLLWYHFYNLQKNDRTLFDCFTCQPDCDSCLRLKTLQTFFHL